MARDGQSFFTLRFAAYMPAHIFETVLNEIKFAKDDG